MKAENIYFIGICGIAMGTLAQMFHERGYSVSGSDADVYPPMSEILPAKGITVHAGFHRDHLKKADIVIIGNAISRGNAEVEHVLDRRIPYLSMAQALYQYFLHDREVIAVAGTHGKTTTSALLAHILQKAGRTPSFFIGGMLKNYDSNCMLGKGNFFVIEGDEYDSAFFEKVPKFMIYRPHHLILTSLEFDHADIYRDLEEIELWFRRLVNIIPSGGNIIYSAAHENLKKIVSRAFSRSTSFGRGDADVTWELLASDRSSARLRLHSGNQSFAVASGLTGGYNYMNIAAAAAMAINLGIGSDDIAAGIGSFAGVKRRMDLIYEKGNVTVYEDFAHHPTAIRHVLTHLREMHQGYVLWAVYEPRSATSRRKVFQNVLPESFSSADRILFRRPYKIGAIEEGERLDIQRIKREINSGMGYPRAASIHENADEIVKEIIRTIDLSKKNIIVVMSNGGFEGIYEKLKSGFDILIEAKG